MWVAKEWKNGKVVKKNSNTVVRSKAYRFLALCPY